MNYFLSVRVTLLKRILTINVVYTYFTELPEKLLKRKIDLCHELIEIADKLEPGMSKFRGELLLDLQAAMTIQTKREFEAGKITKAGAQVR